MSGTRPETPEELRLLAGEYVLGVLGSAEMRAVDQQATNDPLLAHAIAGWERRLGPMLTAVAEVAPPDTLWARIAHAKSLAPGAQQGGKPPARLALVPATAARPPAGPFWSQPTASRRAWPWKVATAGSLALAAGLAALMFMPSLAHQPTAPMPGAPAVSLVAMLAQPENRGEPRQDTTPQMASETGTARLVEPSPATADPAPAAGRMAGFLAAAWTDGTVVLTALAPAQIPDGKTMELWIQPPDATAPRSLGAVPADGRQARLPTMPVNGTTLLVSLEPSGGSPTGAPTGRIVYMGTLRQLRP